MAHPLSTPQAYEEFIYTLPHRYRSIRYSTYEVSHTSISFDTSKMPDARTYCKATYPHKEKLYWYDSFPHPNDPALAKTHPHHKHVPPDIKRHRMSAPNLSFTQPNLPVLIEEIEETLLGNS